jgi:hypothetical protein
MKTNSSWIKADYHVQTYIGLVAVLLLSSAIICLLLVLFGWADAVMWVYLSVSFSLFLLFPFGIWQVVSGFIYAINGDRLQQIYLGVIATYFSLAYAFFKFDSLHREYEDAFLLLMSIIAVIIAVWKYTVVRADYISLKIIDVPKVEIEDFLDA